MTGVGGGWGGEPAAGGGPRRLRVLSCIKCLGFGGAERLLVSAARCRDAGRFDHEAATVLPGYQALVPELEETGVPVRVLGRSDRDWDLRWALSLRRLLRHGHYDIVHFHLPYTASVGRLVVRTLPAWARPKVVTTEHNLWRINHLPLQLLNFLTLPLDDAVIAVSRHVRDAAPRRHRHRFEVVVHGVPVDDDGGPDLREALRSELGVAPGEVLIGTVANLRPAKGYDLVVEAARQLVEQGLPVRFVAVGHGPLEAEVRAHVDRLGLGDRFRLLGARADATRLLSAFDIFVLASLSEGFPISVMEALSQGVPVVSSAVGGVPDAVENGVHGLVVAPGDAAALAGALAQLVTDPSRRAGMALAARQRGATFDIAHSVRIIESIYERLAGASAPGRAPAGPG